MNGINGYLLVLFFLFAIEDLRRHSIPCWWIAAGFLPGLFFYLAGIWSFEGDVALGIILGSLYLLICAVSRGKLGMADGMTAILTGFYLGVLRSLQILVFSFLAGGLVAIVFLMSGKKKLQDEIPMLPFYFLGLLLQVCLSVVELEGLL